MENSVIGIVILVVTLLSFVGVAAWFVWAAQNWAWPKGRRIEREHEGYKCTVIFSEKAEEELGEELAPLVARAGALAASCASAAWIESRVDPSYNPDIKLAHTVVRIVTEDEYSNDYVAAHLDKVGKRVGGDYLPMTVTKSKYTSLILETGEPVIHELCHEMVWKAVNDGIPDYRGHKAPKVWEATGGKTSVQGVAKAKFKAGSSELNVV